MANSADKELLECQNLRMEAARQNNAQLPSCNGAAVSTWLLVDPTMRLSTTGNGVFSVAGRAGMVTYAQLDTPLCVCSGMRPQRGPPPA